MCGCSLLAPRLRRSSETFASVAGDFDESPWTIRGRTCTQTSLVIRSEYGVGLPVLIRIKGQVPRWPHLGRGGQLMLAHFHRLRPVVHESTKDISCLLILSVIASLGARIVGAGSQPSQQVAGGRFRDFGWGHTLELGREVPEKLWQ